MNTQYREMIDNLMDTFAKRVRDGYSPTAAEMLNQLDWRDANAKDNAQLVKWAKAQNLIKDRDVARAKHHAAVVAKLGRYPASATDLIELLVENLNARVTYNGLLSMLDIDTGEQIDCLLTDLERDARMTVASLRLEFGREDVNDAADCWFAKAKRERFILLRDSLEQQADFDWENLAQTCFDTSELGATFVADVLRKFVHQVVCKLHRAPVGHHLMPILQGPQGIGKSYFMNQFIGPMAELKREADFQQITDSRNIELWASYILVFDEMAYASF